ncbi:hypothetical protein BCV69DRAFT_234942, partial [Microstroma glucosiphilum]
KRSNPDGTYAPTILTTCPGAPSNQTGGATGYVRNGTSQEINANETAYITKHRQALQSSWSTWLSSASPGPNLGGDFDVSNYTNTLSNIPRTGIAISGGGYRAMLYGLGVTQGLDERNSTASGAGVGGILQRADYIAGLSGGSWATGAYAINGFPTAQRLVDEVLDLNNNLVLPSDGTVSFYADLVGDVSDKRDENFPTSITDYWGRALSYHLLNDTTYPDQGQATTFSDIRNTSSFTGATYPYPVVIADEREPGETLIFSNTTIFEFSPYEYGTWDRIQAFVPIDVLGSNISNGEITRCVEGFENFGWVVGTSASLFNGALIDLLEDDGNSIIKSAIESVLQDIGSQDNDVSQVPNPFANYSNNELASQELITMVDGGLDNQNVPLWPLLQPARQLDFILALDASADTTLYWPNGSSLYQVTLRAQSGVYPEIPSPYFPSTNTFVNRGLNTRPVFFGCNASNATNAGTAARGFEAPIVAYVPNYPYTYLTNFSTYQLAYNATEAQGMLDNGVVLASLGGNNATWSQCLACGMLERSWARSGVSRPEACTTCMNTYCWDGVEDDSTPAEDYSPAIGTPQWVGNTDIQATPPSSGAPAASSSA